MERVGNAAELDYEKTPKHRNVRLSGTAPVVGEPVRVAMSGVEIEGRISKIDGLLLHVKVKAHATQGPADPQLQGRLVRALFGRTVR